MRIVVYVEGPSDREALRVALRDLLAVARTRRIAVLFAPQDSKSLVLKDCPRKAALGLEQHPEDLYIVLPDLYPPVPSGPFAHRTFEELLAVLQRRFDAEADLLGLSPKTRARFRVHCSKYDLESLLLASPAALRKHLNTKDALGGWTRPVENQNHDKPPKLVVDDLFKKYVKRRYDETKDSVGVLTHTALAELEAACPQHFAPFVADLRAAIGAEP